MKSTCIQSALKLCVFMFFLMFGTEIFRIYYQDVRKLPYLWHLYSNNTQTKIIIGQVFSVGVEIMILMTMLVWMCKKSQRNEKLLVFGCLIALISSVDEMHYLITKSDYFYLENLEAISKMKYTRMYDWEKLFMVTIPFLKVLISMISTILSVI